MKILVAFREKKFLCLCVEVDIQQRAIWFSEKASLRNFKVILFECRGPWMLKTDGLIFLGNIKYLSAQQSLWGCVVKIC